MYESSFEEPAPAPVFVDQSGLRGRLLRGLGWPVSVVGAVLAVAMGSSLIGVQADAPAMGIPAQPSRPPSPVPSLSPTPSPAASSSSSPGTAGRSATPRTKSSATPSKPAATTSKPAATTSKPTTTTSRGAKPSGPPAKHP
ncbi:hypothetical protein [Streptomyces sp. NPDC048349]|uniref:hypothetical protein n=1 Tax=Streptomyces sp. NPDC048349 TaxID=3155486 RepID=UPI003445C7B2